MSRCSKRKNSKSSYLVHFQVLESVFQKLFFFPFVLLMKPPETVSIVREILYLYKPSMARSAVVSRLSSLQVYCPSSSVLTSLMMSLCTLSETCVEYLPPILMGLPFLYH